MTSTSTSTSTTTTTTQTWTSVCATDDILPNTGVCALVGSTHVAVFRVKTPDGQDQFFAIDNYDPKSQASVLSRGLIGSLGDRTVVASPMYKHHYDLRTGECLELPEHSVRAHEVRLEAGQVQIGIL